MCFYVLYFRMRYGELLSRFNDVHSEKKSIQEQFDTGCFDSIKLEEKLKVCIKNVVFNYILSIQNTQL